MGPRDSLIPTCSTALALSGVSLLAGCRPSTRGDAPAERGDSVLWGHLCAPTVCSDRGVRSRSGDDRKGHRPGRPTRSSHASAALRGTGNTSPSTCAIKMLAQREEPALQLPDFALNAPTTEPSVGCRR